MSIKFIQYAGMSYEQASREAERIIKSGYWYRDFDRLATLREIMKASKKCQKV